MIPETAAGTGMDRVARAGAAPAAGPEPAKAASAAAPSLAFGATCPECGGSIRINEGDRSIRCGYCGSALYVTSPRGVQSYILPPRVTPAKARLSAIHYIAERTDGRIGARNTSALDMKLIHVPFWRMRARLMGWLSGDRVKLAKTAVAPDDPTAGPSYATVREVHEAYSRLVFKRIDWSAPACVLPYLGLQGISLRTSFLEWYVLDDARRHEYTIALPTRSERGARKDALSYLTHLAIPAGTSVRASRFHLFDSRFSLYYYPVYMLRYCCAGRIYTITVDGGNGSVVRGEVPRQRRLDAKKLFFAPALLAFFASAWLPLAFIAAAVLYASDTIRAKLLLPPHAWLASRIQTLLEGED
ncbi:MAG: hypothetical protein PHD74_04895 [Candidatus Krumholzibacteria bacterium]|nr:hypothetical protein [Candidatus Krumholzibacteria bacterium]